MSFPLEAPARLVTTHNAEGKAVFSKAVPEKAQQKLVGKEAVFALGYTTSEFPADLNEDKDIEAFKHYESQPPGLVVNSGTVLRYVDVAPGHISPMHRTVSLDFGVVLAGDIELVLDSGETRRMAVGDVAIQRGTMHAWKNVGTTWGRMMYGAFALSFLHSLNESILTSREVLQPCKPVVTADGTTLKEDYANMEGVRPSS